MKIRSFFYAAAAALVMSSCARVSETTVITGTADLPGLEQVAFSIPNVIDTLVPVVDGKFSVELPVHIEDLARLEAASSRAVFVSDGTPLTIVLRNSLQAMAEQHIYPHAHKPDASTTIYIHKEAVLYYPQYSSI